MPQLRTYGLHKGEGDVMLHRQKAFAYSVLALCAGCGVSLPLGPASPQVSYQRSASADPAPQQSTSQAYHPQGASRFGPQPQGKGAKQEPFHPQVASRFGSANPMPSAPVAQSGDKTRPPNAPFPQVRHRSAREVRDDAKKLYR